MIELHSRNIQKARDEVEAILRRFTTLSALASYYKCTKEWHDHVPNETNTEILRLLDEHFAKRQINIRNFY